MAEYDGSGSLLRKFIVGPGIDEPICMVVASGAYAGTYWYHFDALGSVVALSKYDNTLGTAEIVERYRYSAFGETEILTAGYSLLPDSQYANPYMFTGRRRDAETGLYYYRARYYKPDLGRFLQPDPIGYTDGMNMYAYVGNNPTRFVDPMGLRIQISENASRGDRRAYKKAIKILSESELFQNTYNYLSQDDTPLVIITFPTNEEDASDSCHISEAGYSMIYWNRYDELETLRGMQSPIIALAHEMEHAWINMIGGINTPRVEINGQSINLKEEEYIVEWFETPISKILGEPWREDYFEPYRIEQERSGKGCPKK